MEEQVLAGGSALTGENGGAERMELSDGSRVGVIGGGPSGSFFTYFLLEMAARAGLDIQVDVYEPRDFWNPGPAGCNMCAGIVSETLVQNLSAEGLHLPGKVVQRGIDSYILHMDVGSVRIDTPLDEKRIGAVYRGAGPRDLKDRKFTGLDGHLLKMAVDNGAQLINERVNEVSISETGHPVLGCRGSEARTYDLVAVCTGVNSSLMRLFKPLDLDYTPPETTKTYLREYYLGKETVSQVLGNAIQVFLLDIPNLEFGMLIPKDEYMTVCLLGEDIDKDLVRAFMDSPEVQRCLPPELAADNFSCHCSPRINTIGSRQPYGDRLVFVGDSGSTRLYKDGIGSAYRTAKVAARTAVFQGISSADFERHYGPATQAVEYDNDIGRLIFTVVKQIQKRRFARRAVLRMILNEKGKPGPLRRMSTVQWDMYTGSGSYKEILMRTLNPAFLLRLGWDILASLFSRQADSDIDLKVETVSAHDGDTEASKLGRRYQPGELLIEQGTRSGRMIVIQEGQVAIVQEDNGEEVFLKLCGPGEILGEMAFFDQTEHSASVRALGEVVAITVDHSNFNKRIHEDPSMAYRLFKLMSSRVRSLNQQVIVLNKQIDQLSEAEKETSSPG